MKNHPDYSDKNSSYRKSRIIFVIVMFLISIFLLWPGYLPFSTAKPFVFGFPLSFAWIIFCTIVGFIALLALYTSDYRNAENE